MKVVVAQVCISFLLLLSSCIKSRVIVQVAPDGTGNVVLMKIVKKRVADKLEQANQNVNNSFDNFFYNEQVLKGQSALFGTNISYLKSKKIEGPEGRGYLVAYSFQKIDDLCIPWRKAFESTFFYPGLPEDYYKKEEGYTFSLTNGNLQVHQPKELLALLSPKEKVKESETYSDEYSLVANRCREMCDHFGNPFMVSSDAPFEELFCAIFKDFSLSFEIEPLVKSSHREKAKRQIISSFSFTGGYKKECVPLLKDLIESPEIFVAFMSVLADKNEFYHSRENAVTVEIR